MGGDGDDKGYGIVCDSSGKTLITGSTTSSDFPRANPVQNTYGGSSDAFMTRLSSAGNSLLDSTYLGENARDLGRGISVDSNDNIYITGETKSTDFPTTNPYQDSMGGISDVFITKFSSTGKSILGSTYLGGDLYDTGLGIVVDQMGNAYITGSTKKYKLSNRRSLSNNTWWRLG